MSKYEEMMIEIADYVHDHPEPGFREFKSSAKQVEFLKREGFEVIENVADTVTGYAASYGHGHPVIALLGEFDALYGLGQVCDVYTEESDGREMGHGCGHHLLGTGCILAGLLIRDYLKETGREGTVVIYGCPAEESGVGKSYMARDGIFHDTDIALAWHPGVYNMVNTGSSQSCIHVYFRFHGISSHAAASPENGRSALDAVELLDVGVNYMREHMKSTDRIHYAITDTGGKSPNVVQSYAEVHYYIRSVTNKDCVRLYERVCNVARGAALMTETELEIAFDTGLSNTIPNFVLEDVLYSSFVKLGAPVYTDEEKEIAKKYQDTFKAPVFADLPEAVKDKRKLFKNIKESPLCDYVVETDHSEVCGMGSTDVGDVSWVVPTSTLNTACFSYGASAHSWQWVAQGKNSSAHKGMMKAGEVLADAAVSLIEHPELIEKAKEEFNERLNGETYECLIPKEIKPH